MKKSTWKRAGVLGAAAVFLLGLAGCGAGGDQGADASGQKFKSNEEAAAAYRQQQQQGGSAGSGPAAPKR